jgi:hypothetical protein
MGGHRVRLIHSSILALTGSLMACASSPEPVEQLARAKLAVEEAERGEGAALELSAARDKLVQAERAAAERDHDAARRAAEQAEVDARLALAKARRDKAQAGVEELERTIQAMNEEISDDTP